MGQMSRVKALRMYEKADCFCALMAWLGLILAAAGIIFAMACAGLGVKELWPIYPFMAGLSALALAVFGHYWCQSLIKNAEEER